MAPSVQVVIVLGERSSSEVMREAPALRDLTPSYAVAAGPHNVLWIPARRQMCVIGGRAQNIYSQRGFRVLTRCGVLIVAMGDSPMCPRPCERARYVGLFPLDTVVL